MPPHSVSGAPTFSPFLSSANAGFKASVAFLRGDVTSPDGRGGCLARRSP
jgi:hypothetical protein